jgi:hypothetical protein
VQCRTAIGLTVLAMAALTAGGSASAAPGAATGPSSSQSPYLVRSEPGVVTESILTVGDSVNLKPDGVTPYRFVGIPDGLGAYDNGDGTFTVLANHELPSSDGVAREHGSKGAFVSRWTINKDTLEVLHGEDLIRRIALWNGDAESGEYAAPVSGPAAPALNRLCSADLPVRSALFNAATGMGFDGRLFLDGEESSEGRGFAHAADGTSYELAQFGNLAFENSVANPATGDKTVVALSDDTSTLPGSSAFGGQVYIHHGTKRSAGNPAERAGLTGGTLYGIKVDGMRNERAGFVQSSTFSLVALDDQSQKTGAELESESDSEDITEFARPEDLAWDPTNPNVLYLNTTNAFELPSRLWKLTFEDPADPAKGGTIEAVLDGSEGQKMLDNMTVNGRGQVIEQEDPGNNTYLAKLRLYDPASDSLTEIAKHDPARFTLGGANFLTTDEESSGVIGVGRILGRGWYLADVQAHYATDPELVEGGQLLALHVPPGRKYGR